MDICLLRLRFIVEIAGRGTFAEPLTSGLESVEDRSDKIAQSEGHRESSD